MALRIPKTEVFLIRTVPAKEELAFTDTRDMEKDTSALTGSICVMNALLRCSSIRHRLLGSGAIVKFPEPSQDGECLVHGRAVCGG